MSNRGHDRERAVKAILEVWRWVVVRSAGSLGPVDLMAVGCGHVNHPLLGARSYALPQVMLVEVKSTGKGPFERFGPTERREASKLAARCGGKPLLAWWPPGGGLQWIEQSTWPLS